MKNKILNNNFIKSTSILLFGGILGKLVGFLIKIITTRYLKTDGVAIYSLLSPTISLLSTISVFSLPTAVSTLISKNKYNSKDLIYTTIITFLIFNIFIVLFIIVLSNKISNIIIKDNSLILPIISIAITIPFNMVSSIIKGYFWGKQDMFPYILSNFLEQIIRILLVILFINKFNNITYTICFIILINVIGEVFSWMVMLLFIKNKINFQNIKYNIKYLKDLLNICIPSTVSKLVGSFIYFLEPIILNNILIYMGLNKEFIIYEYGIVNGYSLSLLLLPQFFTQNMSTSLIPELSKYYSKHNYFMCKKRIKQILVLSMLIGSISTLFIYLFGNKLLYILYNTTSGYDYIKLLSPFTILFYIEYPLISALHALNKSKMCLIATSITSIVRLLIIIVFSLLNYGIYSYIVSIILNLIFSTYIYYRLLNKTLNF